ncbi:MAG: hypothetical protein HYV95_07220 [Opitutae bacterium]|nr:hypothetical protein [Opitutae bacterium]
MLPAEHPNDYFKQKKTPMFPFESDFNKHKPINQDEATRRLSLTSGADFCYTTPTGSLPQSLQRPNNLVGSFVSGFAPEAQSSEQFPVISAT